MTSEADMNTGTDPHGVGGQGVGILISTYNGATKLPATLRSLAALDISGLGHVSLTVVDNASTDGTADLAGAEWAALGHPFPLTIISEPRPGKLNAQETGLASIAQPFVLICDDDNSLFPDYLRIGVRYLTDRPNIGVLGGRGMAVSTVPIPDWFAEYAYFFACAPQAPATGEVRPIRNVVYGAGMWLRMEGYRRAKQLGFRFLLASRTGRSLATGGEDSELCWALRFQGYEVWYVDELRFHHHVPADRLTEDYRQRLLKGMHANGPLGGIYLRVANGAIRRPVRLFWFKELVYTLIDLVLLPFSKTEDRKAERWRMMYNMQYLVRERGNYDQAIEQLMYYRDRARQNTHGQTAPEDGGPNMAITEHRP
ncbi:MAG: glycosyltransferase family 2 protein [Flavobacteriales bacterium]|nr:glycosyltransferase family 2 protein [Flavobacteriales bacterium]